MKGPVLPRGGFRLTVGGPDLTEHYPEFDKAFGEFIRNFGALETSMALLIEQLTMRSLQAAGVKSGQPMLDIVRALIGARRTPELVNAIKLCAKAVMREGSSPFTDEQYSELEKLFAQVGEIRFLRDRTAHFWPSPRMIEEKLWWRVHTRWAVRDLDQSEELFFTIEHIRAAASDLEAIRKWMWWDLGFGKPKEGELRPTWQYHPRELIRVPAEWVS